MSREDAQRIMEALAENVRLVNLQFESTPSEGRSPFEGLLPRGADRLVPNDSPIHRYLVPLDSIEPPPHGPRMIHVPRGGERPSIEAIETGTTEFGRGIATNPIWRGVDVVQPSREAYIAAGYAIAREAEERAIPGSSEEDMEQIAQICGSLVSWATTEGDRLQQLCGRVILRSPTGDRDRTIAAEILRCLNQTRIMTPAEHRRIIGAAPPRETGCESMIDLRSQGPQWPGQYLVICPSRDLFREWLAQHRDQLSIARARRCAKTEDIRGLDLSEWTPCLLPGWEETEIGSEFDQLPNIMPIPLSWRAPRRFGKASRGEWYLIQPTLPEACPASEESPGPAPETPRSPSS